MLTSLFDKVQINLVYYCQAAMFTNYVVFKLMGYKLKVNKDLADNLKTYKKDVLF